MRKQKFKFIFNEFRTCAHLKIDKRKQLYTGMFSFGSTISLFLTGVSQTALCDILNLFVVILFLAQFFTWYITFYGFITFIF